jgi:hypothetical protein
MKGAHAGAYGLDDAYALVPEDPSGRARRHVAFQDVQIRAADGRPRDFDDRIAGSEQLGLRAILQGFFA